MASPELLDIQNKEGTLHTTLHKHPSDDAETIFLLHGGPGVPEPYTKLAEALNSKYQIITFEQRGTGLSHHPSRDYSMEGYISDIDAIAEHFQLKKFHLFGQSWGGLYAQIYANANPERISSMFLSSPSSGTNTLWVETEKEVLAYNQRKSSDWDFLKMGWYSLWGMLGFDSPYQSLFELVIKAYHKDHSPDVTIGDLTAIKADPINLTRPKIREYKPLPERVENPSFRIMLTYGDDDIYGPSKVKCIERYPTAKIEIIENCGHMPWVHNPDRFDAIFEGFYSLK